MFARDFWRGRWHRISEEFRIISGPEDTSVSTSGAYIEWQTSEGATSQVEYGTSSGSYTLTTTEVTTTTETEHGHELSDLDYATTYYYRTKNTSAGDVTIYSDEHTFQTAGDPVSSGIGLRYDIFGAGASGNFPAFPTIGGSTVLLPAATAAAGHTAISNFINSQSSGTTIVFDSSGGGTDYGAGTEIDLDLRIDINNGNSTLKSNVHLWGYNCKINQSRVRDRLDWYGDSRFFWFSHGGFEGWTVSGFWFNGPNTNAYTWDSRTAMTDPTYGPLTVFEGHGVDITAWKDLTIEDCYFTQMTGEAVGLMNWDLSLNVHYPPWSASGPSGFEMRYCHVNGTGRQGICLRQGSDIWVHHNIIEGSALWTINQEEWVENDPAFLDGVTIEDNIIRNWSCHMHPTDATAPPNMRMWGLCFECHDGRLDYINDVTIRRNTFEWGCYGFGSPSAEIERYGYTSTDGGEIVIGVGLCRVGVARNPPISNVTVADNIFDLEAGQVTGDPDDSSLHLRGLALDVCGCDTLTITNNDFQGKPIRILGCTNVTNTGNDIGTVYTT